MKYRMQIIITDTYLSDVEAKSYEEALQIASDMIAKGLLNRNEAETAISIDVEELN